MVERLTWKKLALELAFFYFPWFLIGWFYGDLPWFLLIATLLVLIWNFYHQIRLSDWLWKDRKLVPPSGKGSWAPLFNGIYRLQKRNRRRRKELTNLIRRFRNGANLFLMVPWFSNKMVQLFGATNSRRNCWVCACLMMQASTSVI